MKSHLLTVYSGAERLSTDDIDTSLSARLGVVCRRCPNVTTIKKTAKKVNGTTVKNTCRKVDTPEESKRVVEIGRAHV